mmetsp:Transcript_2024/g.4362  ORF Transcript_2024/g.4362 Transcript_2024/m.4362 type:complete len:336 (+) Transcript_2024:213-1220(+)
MPTHSTTTTKTTVSTPFTTTTTTTMSTETMPTTTTTASNGWTTITSSETPCARNAARPGGRPEPSNGSAATGRGATTSARRSRGGSSASTSTTATARPTRTRPTTTPTTTTTPATALPARPTRKKDASGTASGASPPRKRGAGGNPTGPRWTPAGSPGTPAATRTARAASGGTSTPARIAAGGGRRRGRPVRAKRKKSDGSGGWSGGERTTRTPTGTLPPPRSGGSRTGSWRSAGPSGSAVGRRASSCERARDGASERTAETERRKKGGKEDRDGEERTRILVRPDLGSGSTAPLVRFPTRKYPKARTIERAGPSAATDERHCGSLGNPHSNGLV